MLQKHNGKQSFITLSNNNHVNDKNTPAQVPTGKSKQTKNRLMSVVRHAIGNDDDESERASHAINNLEKTHAGEIKNFMVDRGCATNSIKKIQPVEALSMITRTSFAMMP